jgi:hypothetical protein
MNYEAFSSSVARQAAAADLWMELTGRKQAAAFEVAQEKLAAVGPVADSEEKPAPKLRVPVGVGAAAGGVAGAAGGVGLARAANKDIGKARRMAPDILGKLRHKPVSAGKAGLAAGAIGAGIGATAGLGYGIHRLVKHYKNKQASAPLVHVPAAVKGSLKKKLLGAAIGATGAGLAGGALHYRSARKGKSGKSKNEIRQEAELQRLKGMFEHQGKDVQKLKGMGKLRKQYKELVHRHHQEAAKNPAAASAIASIPYAAVGGVLGGSLASKVLK